MTSDLELLQTYHQTRSDEAFKLLIERYMPMVYAACRRQLRDDHLAQDATQGVFVVLSQKAGKLRHPSLAGWLLTTARYACSSIRRTQTRQERRERIVAMNQDHAPPRDSDELLALLDEGLHRLAEPERQAVVLRYLQDQSFKDVGSHLGISEEAARKRVDRGMYKLRYYFGRRGIQTSAPAVAAVLTHQAHAAMLPPDLSASITQGILQACHAGASSTSAGILIAKGVHSMIFIAKIKTAALIAALLAVLISGSWIATHALAQNNAAATPPPAAVLKTAATAPAVDLSTPEHAVTSFVAALKAGDRDKAYACLTLDPKKPPTLIGAALEQEIADTHMTRTLHKVFGDNAPGFTGVGADQVLDLLLSVAPKAQIEGDTATMIFTLPPQIVAVIPGDLGDTVKAWQGKPLRFIKLSGHWKIDAEHTMKFIVDAPTTAKLTPEETAKRDIALMLDLARLSEDMATQLGTGELKTLDDVQEFRQSRFTQIDRRYGIAGFSTNGVPAEASKIN